MGKEPAFSKVEIISYSIKGFEKFATSGIVMEKRSRYKYNMGSALVVLSAFGFATLGIFGKAAFEAGLGANPALMLRFGFAAPLMLLLAARVGGDSGGFRFFLQAALFGGIGIGVEASLFFFTLKRFGAALTGVFLYLYPAFVILFSRVVHRQLISPGKIGALSMALIGSLLTSGIAGGVSEGGGTPLQDPVGLLAGVMTGAWYAVYILAGDRLVRDRDPVWTSAGVVAGSAVVFSGLVGMEAFTGSARFGNLGGRAWVAIAGLALFSTVLPFSTLYAGMKRVGAVRASLLSTLELAFTVILAFLFSGEKLTFWQTFGAALVLISVVLASAREGESKENGAPC